ncbi:MAG: hypothetical protein IJ518_00135 [Clostridia bacterium]|nr:hypothetical protein [Clostridia bacterium]
MKKIREWLNIQLVKNPGQMVLSAILLFNILFFLVSAVIISSLSLAGTEHMSFMEATFCTITMILDAGCIQFVVEDIGTAGVATVIICLAIVLVGMISFTGAVIGYITNYIASFIDHANAGARQLKIYDHAVILNWNSRASEIVNDLLYAPTKQRVVVLVGGRRDEIEKEINERLADTIARENREVAKQAAAIGGIRGLLYAYMHAFRRNVTVIVREGDVFSSKQLHDISLEQARMVIVLGNDINNTLCKFEHKELTEQKMRGNAQTIKTLMQVADITAAAYSADKQKIIVEITDDWTAELVDKIIAYKQVEGKCNIVPVRVNQVLGHILSQFSLMPELNLAYRELFSNKGAAFFAEEQPAEEEINYLRQYLATHTCALPLTFMESHNQSYAYYAAVSQRDVSRKGEPKVAPYSVNLNADYWIERKNIILLGHNSRCEEIMKGFEAFRKEWGYKDRDEEIVRVLVIDDEKHLEKMNYYRQYPFVVGIQAAQVYDREVIYKAIREFVDANEEDTSVLILSDDSALNENIDADALANLIYVQDIIQAKKEEDPSFDEESIDVVVEIINPKHHDIVNSYSVNNVVISNRYISKMITQIGEKDALFDFYSDILTYDMGDGDTYESKEVYVKKVSRLFTDVPAPCTAEQLVRAVFEASVDASLPKERRNPTIVLGYVKPGGHMVLFGGEQADIPVTLDSRDKLIVFSNH